jgi:transketolase
MVAMINYNARTFSRLGQSGSIFGLLAPFLREKYPLKILSSDMSNVAGINRYKSLFPEDFYNVGIAEQNLIGISSGLASEGFIPVAVAQAAFISMRSFEQVRQYMGYMQHKVISVGILSGFSLTYFGNTHYALEDLSLMKSIPNMVVLSPADAGEAVKAMESAICIDHPVYLRLHGTTMTPIVYKNDFEYVIGKANNLVIGKDIQIIATGSMVFNALKVSELLAKEGISCTVTDMHTIKPLDTDCIDFSVKQIVTLEEHHLIGGMGSSVSDYLALYSSHPKLLKIGVEDNFSKVGDYEYLIKENNLSVEKITEKIKSSL